MSTITRRITRARDIVEHDRRVAEANATAAVIAESCELAPYSYAALRAARDAGTLGALLAALPAHLVRPQAVRFLVERKAAHPDRMWGWGDVDAVAEAFARVARAAVRAAVDAAAAEADGDALAVDAAAANADAAAGADADAAAKAEAHALVAALTAHEAEAHARGAAARDDGDRDLARAARRTAQACRDAAGIVHAGTWFAAPNGGLLVASRSQRGVYHRVGRDGVGRIACTCPWTGLGPCAHRALFVAWEESGGDNGCAT